MNATKEVFQAYTFAYDLARRRKDEYVTAEHLLYAMLEENEVLRETLKGLGANISNIKKGLLKYLDENLDKVKNEKLISDARSFEECFLFAEQLAHAAERKLVGIEHIMSAVFNLDQTYAKYLLEKQGVTMREFLYAYCYQEGDRNSDLEEEWEGGETEEEAERIEEKETRILEKYAQNLNEFVKGEEYEPLVGREDVLNRTIQILCRKEKNNPIHIGEAGVGKTAVTLGLAYAINQNKVPDKLKGATLYSLDLGALLAGSRYRGDFEERMKVILDIIKKRKNGIIYIDEIHTIVGAGALGDATMDAANLLKPYLTGRELRFIGATTYDEYKKYFEKQKALDRRFGKIEIKELSVEETILILQRLKAGYEKFHKVVYTDDALVFAARLSDKFINGKYLPDKAIDLIDEAGAFVHLKGQFHGEQSGKKTGKKKTVDRKVIEEILSKSLHIPEQSVRKEETGQLRSLEQSLGKQVFGQKEAIDSISRLVKMSRAGLNEKDKPIASVLFVGPTGVGKTELAKCLAAELGIGLVRFDMSEYGEKHTASKLIGSPPGYVGYEEGGMLTDAIRKQPHCVLLLDEIEKAHMDVMNVLLQIMDAAELTDSQGRKADFQNVMLIMTSNAGARWIQKGKIGFGEDGINNQVLEEEIKRAFSPEFRNRLDGIITFQSVNKEMAYEIAKKELESLKTLLLEKNVTLQYTKAVTTYVADKGVSREYGAREIKRIVQKEIKSLFVEELLFGKLQDGGTCKLDRVKEKITIVPSKKL